MFRRSRIPLAAVAAALVIVGSATGYALTAGEYSSVLGAFVVRDPLRSIAASRTSGASGAVVHLDVSGGVLGRGYAEFRSGAYRAYSAVLVTASGVDAVVPLRRANGTFVGGDVEVRLVAPFGPLWSASAPITFAIEAPTSVTATPGSVSLFATEVARALVSHSRSWAGAAAAAGASVPQDYFTSADRQSAELAALSAELENAAAGSADRVTVAGVAGARTELVTADQIVAAQMAGWGPASPSPCGEGKDRELAGVASGSIATIAAIKQAALRYASAIAACDEGGLRDVALRANAWLGITLTEMYLDMKDAPKLAGLLLIRVASIGDSTVDATRLWRSAMLGRDLRALVLEDRGTLAVGSGDDVYIEYEQRIGEGATNRVRMRLSDELRQAAEQDTLLGGIIRSHRDMRDAIEAVSDRIEADFAKDAQGRDRVARALADVGEMPTQPQAEPQPQPQAESQPPAAATTAPPTTVAPATPSPASPAPTAAPATAPAPAATTPTDAPAAGPPTTTAPPQTAAPTPTPTAAAPPQSTSTITPARDLTSTWRGGIASTGHYRGDTTCKWTGSVTLELTQTDNVLTGEAQLSFQKGQAVLAGASCAGGVERYQVSGTVTGSAVRFQFVGGYGRWYGTVSGSFTTDLMYATFSGSGEDYGSGCVQVSRTSIGALPNCR